MKQVKWGGLGTASIAEKQTIPGMVPDDAFTLKVLKVLEQALSERGYY